MPLYCKAHKRPNNVIANKPVCQVQECLKSAMYGSIDSREKIYCRKHARPGDVCLLKGYLCTTPGCSSLAIWGEIDGRRHLTCTKHKKPHFVNCHIGRKKYYEEMRRNAEFAEKHGNVVVAIDEDPSDSDSNSDTDSESVVEITQPSKRINMDVVAQIVANIPDSIPVRNNSHESDTTTISASTPGSPIIISEKSPLFTFFATEAARLHSSGNENH